MSNGYEVYKGLAYIHGLVHMGCDMFTLLLSAAARPPMRQM